MNRLQDLKRVICKPDVHIVLGFTEQKKVDTNEKMHACCIIFVCFSHASIGL